MIVTSSKLGLKVVIAICTVACLSQANAQIFEGRWVGGLQIEDDYIAVVFHLHSQSELQGTLAYPNRPEVVSFDQIRTRGSQITFLRQNGTETWDGILENGRMHGTYRSPNDSGKFEIVYAPVVSVPRLRSYEGVYRFTNGKRVRISYLPRINDDLLIYFDETTGENQWLFPANDSSFVAGPTFEMPIPVRRRTTFVLNANGEAASMAWWREGEREVKAERVSFMPDTASLVTYIGKFLKERDVPSVSVGIVIRDSMVWGSAFGYADLEQGQPASLKTLYQIGSVTKVLTATTLMLLRDRGKVRLDDPLTLFLPATVSVPAADQRGDQVITLRHLLTHSAGLPGDPVNRKDVVGVMQPYSVPELYAGLAKTHLQYPVGTKWSYSNLGYALLGQVIERIMKKPFEASLHEELLVPLKMTSTRIELSPADERQLAVHYWPEDKPRKPRPRWVFGDVAGFGGITSNVPDLAKFVRFELRASETDAQPLRGGTIAETQRPQFVFDGWNKAMGIGWMIKRDTELGTILYHGGEVDGHSSYLAISRTHGFGVIVLANLGGSAANDLGESILRITINSARTAGVPTRDQAFTLFFDSDWGDAAWALEVIAKSRPTDGVAWYRLGIARWHMNRFNEAREAFEKAATLDFLPQQALYYVARIHAIRGNVELAFTCLQRAFDAGFKNTDEFRNTPDLESLHNDPRWKEFTGSTSNELR